MIDCPMEGAGYAYERPQYSFTLSGMEACARLEIEVTSACDPTLLVNTSNGQWVFDDDGGGALQPLLNLPLDQTMNGRLDVWVAPLTAPPAPSRWNWKLGINGSPLG